jgi:hypothetical protein
MPLSILGKFKGLRELPREKGRGWDETVNLGIE